jgi:hypothetical protein
MRHHRATAANGLRIVRLHCYRTTVDIAYREEKIRIFA